MKVTLIHPPVYINKNGLTALRPSLPLGLAYIAAVLRDDKHDVSVIDALGEAPEQMVQDGDIWRLGLTPEEIIERLKWLESEGVDYVILSSRGKDALRIFAEEVMPAFL